MTKPETRAFMTRELVTCIAQNHERLPSHIKVDCKGTKNYVSLKDFGVYVCFYVTSSLYYSLWRFGVKEVDKPAILFDKYRSEEELAAAVREVFGDVARWLEEEADVPMIEGGTNAASSKE